MVYKKRERRSRNAKVLVAIKVVSLFYQGWLNGLIYIYRLYISLIYIVYFSSKISDIFNIYDFCAVFYIYFNVTHCDCVLMSVVRVFCWLMTCALSIFSVLDNFCQIAPFHSNAV